MPARRFAAMLCASLTLAAGAADAKAPAVTTGWTQWNAPRDPNLLQNVALDAHNRARRALGLPPLAWSPRLAADAQAHAQAMARGGRLFHAVQSEDDPAWQGENLFAGTRGAYDYRQMLGYWVNERAVLSRHDAGGDAGHYRRIVSRQTTAVGCAMVPGRDDDFLVCRYSPG